MLLLHRRELAYCMYRAFYNNRITSIPSNAFSGLVGLTYLYVTMHLNHVGVIFSHCTCRSLDLNQITSIARGAFTGLGAPRLYASFFLFTLHELHKLARHRYMDTLPTIKAPFNMHSGTQLLTL